MYRSNSLVTSYLESAHNQLIVVVYHSSLYSEKYENLSVEEYQPHIEIDLFLCHTYCKGPLRIVAVHFDLSSKATFWLFHDISWSNAPSIKSYVGLPPFHH